MTGDKNEPSYTELAKALRSHKEKCQIYMKPRNQRQGNNTTTVDPIPKSKSIISV